jgi:hypothetical protein
MATHLLRAVAGKLDEVELVRDPDRAREIGEEDEARLQEGDEQEVAVGVVRRDLRAELPDTCPELVSPEEYLADAWFVCYDARSSRNRWANRSMSRL